MKVSKLVFTGVFALVSTFGALAPATATLANNGKDHKVTICHATNSATNPYVVNTVDYNSIVRGPGHDRHDGGVATSLAHATEMKNNKQTWGDIIPAIAKHNYAGKNLTTEGRTILANGCKFPTVVTPAPEKPVTPEQPTNPTQPTNPGKPENPGKPDKDKPVKGNEKVTLCHATRSAKNPYVRITVSANAVANKYSRTNGHGNHDEAVVATSYEHAEEIKKAGGRWGDVIPAIESRNFTGLSLAEGQELLNNDCRYVTVAGDVIEPEVPVEEDDDVTMPEDEAPVVDTEGEGGVEVLDEAAYTEEPRVANLPVTGGLSALLVLVAGALAAGLTYAAAPIARRLKA